MNYIGELYKDVGLDKFKLDKRENGIQYYSCRRFNFEKQLALFQLIKQFAKEKLSARILSQDNDFDQLLAKLTRELIADGILTKEQVKEILK
jgi:hypothetical protein